MHRLAHTGINDLKQCMVHFSVKPIFQPICRLLCCSISFLFSVVFFCDYIDIFFRFLPTVGTWGDVWVNTFLEYKLQMNDLITFVDVFLGWTKKKNLFYIYLIFFSGCWRWFLFLETPISCFFHHHHKCFYTYREILCRSLAL